MENLVIQLPISTEAKDSLMGKENPLTNILNIVRAYESASWSKMRRACAKFNFDQDLLPDYYTEAIHWADVYKDTTGEII